MVEPGVGTGMVDDNEFHHVSGAIAPRGSHADHVRIP